MKLSTFGPAILITVIGFVIAWQFVNPAPPRHIRIATGSDQGAYYLFARRYREQLAHEGIELEILTTAGSLENLRLLVDDSAGVDLAFVQGGTAGAMDENSLAGLASLFHEPLWVFYRGEQSIDRLTALDGSRLAIGKQDSGTQAVARSLLENNFIDTGAPGIHAIGDREAEQALLTGDVDAAFFVAAPDAPLVQRLLHSNGVRLMNFSRALAYTRLHPYLSTITLPEGIIDLQANIPPEDITLLAPAANLVADENFHPALVSLLLQAATAIHGEGSLLDEPGSFPNTRNLDFPLDDDARRFFRHGPPFLQRYLPFWTANLIDRMKIMLIPLLTLLVPLFKVMPPAYRWRVRRKIYRWYVELRALDVAGPEKLDTEQLQQLLQKLDRIEFDVRKVSVPLSYTDELYDLRQHIGLVRDRLHGTRGQEAVAAHDHGPA
jgi:TRAP-type uncharacterized transport system substrate-binding protein